MSVREFASPTFLKATAASILAILLIESIISYGGCSELYPAGYFKHCLNILHPDIANSLLYLLYPLVFMPFTQFLMSTPAIIVFIAVYSYTIVSVAALVYGRLHHHEKRIITKISGGRLKSLYKRPPLKITTKILLAMFVLYAFAATFILSQAGAIRSGEVGSLSVVDMRCEAGLPGKIRVTVQNIEGTDVKPYEDFLIMLDNLPVGPSWSGDIKPFSIGNAEIACSKCAPGSQHTVRLIGTSSIVTESVVC